MDSPWLWVIKDMWFTEILALSLRVNSTLVRVRCLRAIHMNIDINYL